jgi:hypothetical protein
MGEVCCTCQYVFQDNHNVAAAADCHPGNRLQDTGAALRRHATMIKHVCNLLHIRFASKSDGLHALESLVKPHSFLVACKS